MTFEKALIRARAAHVNTKTVYQSGENYRPQHVCTCGAFVFATRWEQHIVDAADELRGEKTAR